jgi:outer membrane protein OmpA-like peptidoglycan-associated protein
VVDRFDSCRSEQGPASNQGCPEKQKQLVTITRDRLVIQDKVYFATGKAKVLPRSQVLLAQLARILKEHPEVERVSIEGHTDSRGKREANVTLSEARAESVRKFLLAAGVPSQRMVAKGFGPDQPVESNETARGRDANRRVDFVIKAPGGDDVGRQSGVEEVR